MQSVNITTLLKNRMCLARNVAGGSWTSKYLFVWAPRSSGAYPSLLGLNNVLMSHEIKLSHKVPVTSCFHFGQK